MILGFLFTLYFISFSSELATAPSAADKDTQTCSPTLLGLSALDAEHKLTKGTWFHISGKESCLETVNNAMSAMKGKKDFDNSADAAEQFKKRYSEFDEDIHSGIRACIHRGDAGEEKFLVSKAYYSLAKLQNNQEQVLAQTKAIDILLGSSSTDSLCKNIKLSPLSEKCKSLDISCKNVSSDMDAIVTETEQVLSYLSDIDKAIVDARSRASKGLPNSRDQVAITAALKAKNDAATELKRLEAAKEALLVNFPWVNTDTFKKAIRDKKGTKAALIEQMKATQGQLVANYNTANNAISCIASSTSSRSCNAEEIRAFVYKAPDVPDITTGDRNFNLTANYLSVQRCASDNTDSRRGADKIASDFAIDAGLTIFTGGAVALAKGAATGARAALSLSRLEKAALLADVAIGGVRAKDIYDKDCGPFLTNIENAPLEPNQCPTFDSYASQNQRAYGACMANVLITGLIPMAPFVGKIIPRRAARSVPPARASDSPRLNRDVIDTEYSVVPNQRALPAPKPSRIAQEKPAVSAQLEAPKVKPQAEKPSAPSSAQANPNAPEGFSAKRWKNPTETGAKAEYSSFRDAYEKGSFKGDQRLIAATNNKGSRSFYEVLKKNPDGSLQVKNTVTGKIETLKASELDNIRHLDSKLKAQMADEIDAAASASNRNSAQADNVADAPKTKTSSTSSESTASAQPVKPGIATRVRSSVEAGTKRVKEGFNNFKARRASQRAAKKEAEFQARWGEPPIKDRAKDYDDFRRAYDSGSFNDSNRYISFPVGPGQQAGRIIRKLKNGSIEVEDIRGRISTISTNDLKRVRVGTTYPKGSFEATSARVQKSYSDFKGAYDSDNFTDANRIIEINDGFTKTVGRVTRKLKDGSIEYEDLYGNVSTVRASSVDEIRLTTRYDNEVFQQSVDRAKKIKAFEEARRIEREKIRRWGPNPTGTNADSYSAFRKAFDENNFTEANRYIEVKIGGSEKLVRVNSKQADSILEVEDAIGIKSYIRTNELRSARVSTSGKKTFEAAVAKYNVKTDSATLRNMNEARALQANYNRLSQKEKRRQVRALLQKLHPDKVGHVHKKDQAQLEEFLKWLTVESNILKKGGQ